MSQLGCTVPYAINTCIILKGNMGYHEVTHLGNISIKPNTHLNLNPEPGTLSPKPKP